MKAQTPSCTPAGLVEGLPASLSESERWTVPVHNLGWLSSVCRSQILVLSCRYGRLLEDLQVVRVGRAQDPQQLQQNQWFNNQYSSRRYTNQEEGGESVPAVSNRSSEASAALTASPVLDTFTKVSLWSITKPKTVPSAWPPVVPGPSINKWRVSGDQNYCDPTN